MTAQDQLDTTADSGPDLDAEFEQRGLSLLPIAEIPELSGPFSVVGFTPTDDPDGPSRIAVAIATGDDLERFDQAVAAIAATHPELAPATAVSMAMASEVATTLPAPLEVFSVLCDGEPLGIVARHTDRRAPIGEAAEASTPQAAAPGGQPAPQAAAPPSTPATGGAFDTSLGLLQDMVLEVSVELGSSTMPLSRLMNLGVGSVVELDRPAGAPVDVRVNGTLFAHGEVVVVDNEYAVRIIEILAPPK